MMKKTETRIRRGTSLSLTTRKGLAGWLYVLPFLIGFVVIYLPAIVQSAAYSFQEVVLTVDGLETSPAGWKNYYDALLVDTDYRVILLGALRGIFLDSLIILLFSFFIATVLNQKFIGRTFARTVFFLPVILATGLISKVETNDLLMNLYGSNTGAEMMTGLSGGGALFDIKSLLGGLDPDFVNIVTTAVEDISQIVNDSGVQILIFLAGLQAISPSVFEAAKVEGATKWEEFWKITFPMMGPMILVNAIYTIIDTFMRPSYGVLGHIQGLFDTLRFGEAAARSWLFFSMVTLILLVVGLFGWLYTRRSADSLEV